MGGKSTPKGVDSSSIFYVKTTIETTIKNNTNT